MYANFIRKSYFEIFYCLFNFICSSLS